MISPVITARPLGEDITYFPPETQHLTVSVIKQRECSKIRREPFS